MNLVTGLHCSLVAKLPFGHNGQNDSNNSKEGQNDCIQDLVNRNRSPRTSRKREISQKHRTPKVCGGMPDDTGYQRTGFCPVV